MNVFFRSKSRLMEKSQSTNLNEEGHFEDENNASYLVQHPYHYHHALLMRQRPTPPLHQMPNSTSPSSSSSTAAVASAVASLTAKKRANLQYQKSFTRACFPGASLLEHSSGGSKIHTHPNAHPSHPHPAHTPHHLHSHSVSQNVTPNRFKSNQIGGPDIRHFKYLLSTSHCYDTAPVNIGSPPNNNNSSGSHDNNTTNSNNHDNSDSNINNSKCKMLKKQTSFCDKTGETMRERFAGVGGSRGGVREAVLCGETAASGLSDDECVSLRHQEENATRLPALPSPAR